MSTHPVQSTEKKIERLDKLINALSKEEIMPKVTNEELMEVIQEDIKETRAFLKENLGPIATELLEDIDDVTSQTETPALDMILAHTVLSLVKQSVIKALAKKGA